MEKKVRKIQGEEYYTLLCHCGKTYWDALICGVYASKQEAEKVKEEIKKCHARHTIKKCDITISF